MRASRTYETALQAGAVLAHVLRPFVEDHAPVPGDPESWVELISRSDLQRLGRHDAEYALDDPRVILKTIIFHPEQFNGTFSRTDIGWASEALRVLHLANSATTNMSSNTVVEGLEAMELLLDVVGAEKASRRISELADGETFEYAELFRGLEPASARPADVVEAPGQEPDADDTPEGSQADAAASPANSPASFPAPEPSPEVDTQALDPNSPAPSVEIQNEEAPAIEQDTDSSDDRPTDTERGDQDAGEPGTRTPDEELLENLIYYRDSQPGCRTAHFTSGPVRVEVRYREALNFALVHNNVSPIVQVLVGHTDGENSHRVEEIVVSLGDDSHPVSADPLRIEAITMPPVKEHRDYGLQEQAGADLAWHIPARQFADIDESTQTTLRINVVIDGQRETQTHAVKLLARNEWYAQSIPELLAAFVTPNSKALVPVLQRASEILQETTGSSSLEGYQTGSERARSIAAAVYRAIHELDLTYVNPPASFEETGQKIRRVEEVMEDRMGTCLDLSVLYAAALEQAGLNPVIVRVPGHAFAGFFVEDYQLSELALTERGLIENVVRSSLLVPVEMTMVTGSAATSFDDAVKATEKHFDGEIYYVLDIAAAHRRMKPLPRFRTNNVGDVVEVVQDRPAPTPIPLTVPERAEEPGSYRESEEKNFPPRIRAWRHSLLDLSLRNPLLKLPSRAMSLAVAERSLAQFEDMLAAGQKLTLRAQDDIAELEVAAGHHSARDLGDDSLDRILLSEKTLYAGVSVSSYPARMDKLRRDARLGLDESGANSLFVTLGALSWKTSTGQDALAPLFLLPVRLEGGKKQKFRLSIDEGAKAEPNWCLIEKLRAEFNLSIPVLEEPPEDDHGIDVPRVLREIRSALALKKVSFHVQPDVRLAILQFATVEMWRDLGEHWQEFLHNPVVQHLVETPVENFEDPVAAPEITELLEADAVLPVPVDGSQLEAIAWASAGKTFVLEGPPGTGKSQTITNMIADSLDKGKKVLFVAEKQAALEVVRTRLERVGLAPLTLQLHGRKQSVADVRRQLLESWEAEPMGNSASFGALKQDFRRSIESLAAYPERLHGGSIAALSVWQAHQNYLGLAHYRGQADRGSDLDGVPIPPRIIRDAAEADRISAIAGRAEKALKTLGTHRFVEDPWRIAGPEADAADTETTGPGVMYVVREFLAQHDRLTDQGKELFRRYPDPESWTTLTDWLDQVRAGRHMPLADYREVTDRVPDWSAQMELLLADIRQFATELGDFAAALRPHAWGVDTADLQSRIREAEKKLFGKKRLLADLQQHVEGLVVPFALNRVEDPRGFLNQLSWVQERAQKIDMDAQRLLPQRVTWTIRDPRQVGVPEEVLQRSRGVQQVRDLFTDQDLDLFERGGDPVDMAAYLRSWNSMIEALDADSESLSVWRGDDDLLTAIDRNANEWREQAERDRSAGLRRYQRALAALRELEASGLHDLADALSQGRIGVEDLAARLRLRIAREQLADRMDDTDLLQFDPNDRSQRVEEYKSLSNRVRVGLRTELPSRLLRQRGLDKDRPTSAQSQLRRELDRKRGGTIRQLISSSGDAVLDVTPCMLMSPSSVAKNLPVGAIEFDLVIFDEASQIKVADAIGSLGRAKSAVVVGDSQQMPPSSMFASGSSDDDGGEAQDAVVASDQESILSEAVSANLDRKMLTWHYRSQDESLIAYSNRRYYQGELSTFPAPPIERPGFGITLKRVDGHFDGGGRQATRTNQVEAQLIVADVVRRLETDPDTSIGVVTFNKQQQTLIQDLLEDRDDPAVREALAKDEDALIVKNLENMQGDERDVILFSLAFSPDPETKKLRLQFGPLSAQGGHRRLNVAITRARREVVIYSSFDPEHIDLQRTGSEGMKHLREYLMFARENSGIPGGDAGSRTRELHRQDVAAAFREHGFEVREEFGMSKFQVDLAVRPPNTTRWFALMLDGPAWARRSTVSDRDAVPAQVLTRMGWADVIQVWLPSWWQDREQAIQAVRDRMEAADEKHDEEPADAQESLAAPEPEHVPQPASEPEPDLAPEPAPEAESEPEDRDGWPGAEEAPAAEENYERVMSSVAPVVRGARDAALATAIEELNGPLVDHFAPIVVEPFRSADQPAVGELSVLDALATGSNRRRVAEQLVDVIEVEGPVLGHVLASNVAGRFGLGKTNGSRREQILGCVPPDVAVTYTAGEVCYWPRAMDPATWRVVRVDEDASPRSIVDIPPREIENAVLLAIQRAGRPVPVADVVVGTSRVFGYRRTGNRIAGAYRYALDRLLRSGELLRDGDRYRLNS